MKKENKITINNLIYALLFLVLGIFLLTRGDLIGLVSNIIGSILILIGIIKTVIFIYMKGKLGNYSIYKLIIGLVIICFGILFIFYSDALSYAVRIIVGLWIMFTSINRLIFSFSVVNLDKKGFWIFLITSVLMFILGILLISGIFDKVLGLLIIFYSIIEIINYIYVKINDKNIYGSSTTDVVKITKKSKLSKKGKVVDAVIEEEKKEGFNVK
ncbi:MAG: DUF308 domain-containing protein [bacterium]|nr:DUF308 domain-containing protein [bacterium]